LLVADAYYASAKVVIPLLDKQHHLLTRAKSNAVADRPSPKLASSGKGRPRIYGEKVRLRDLANKEDCAFTCAPSPIYGEHDVVVRYRTLDLMWRPVARTVRFVIVHHPVGGAIFPVETVSAHIDERDQSSEFDRSGRVAPADTGLTHVARPPDLHGRSIMHCVTVYSIA